MAWQQLLASILGSVDEGLRRRNMHLVAGNRSLRHQITGRGPRTDTERQTIAAARWTAAR